MCAGVFLILAWLDSLKWINRFFVYVLRPFTFLIQLINWNITWNLGFWDPWLIDQRYLICKIWIDENAKLKVMVGTYFRQGALFTKHRVFRFQYWTYCTLSVLQRRTNINNINNVLKCIPNSALHCSQGQIE